MKRISLLLAIVVTAGAVAFLSYQGVRAATVLSQAQIDAIRDSCQRSQSNLLRLQQSDRLLRANLGQNYDSIARRLMAPLNGRIAINGMDGVALGKTTVSFNDAFTKFRNDYKTYDDDLQKAISVDCTTHPVDQYNAIETARKSREAVYDDTKSLQDLLATYRDQVKDFKADKLGGAS